MSEVSRLQCLLPDKNVGLALRRLAGIVFPEPKVVPLREAQSKNGKVQSTAPGAGKMEDVLLRGIKKKKLREFAAADARAVLAANHLAESSYSVALRNAQDRKLVRRVGKPGGYRYKVL